MEAASDDLSGRGAFGGRSRWSREVRPCRSVSIIERRTSLPFIIQSECIAGAHSGTGTVAVRSQQYVATASRLVQRAESS